MPDIAPEIINTGNIKNVNTEILKLLKINIKRTTNTETNKDEKDDQMIPFDDANLPDRPPVIIPENTDDIM